MTTPAAETKSIGLLAFAHAVMVFASPSGQFYLDVTNSYHLSGHSRLDNFIVTRKSCPLTGTLQKHMPTPTQTATPHTTGPLGCNNIFTSICPLAPGKVCGSTVTNSWFIGIKIFNQKGLWHLCRKPPTLRKLLFI